MTAVAVRPEEGELAEKPPLVPQRNGGALFAGGVKGHRGGTGTTPHEFARLCRHAVLDNELIKVVVRIALQSPSENTQLRAVELLWNRGFGLPTQAIEVSGAFTGPITEQERRARIRELLLNALERIEPADMVEAKP